MQGIPDCRDVAGNVLHADDAARSKLHALCRNLIGHFVVAGAAAWFAVHEAVLAKANINDGLAEDAVFLALALLLGLLALGASNFAGTGSGAHKANVPATLSVQKMTLVIALAPEKAARGRARFLCAL
jgi:hypothetical protein